MALSLKRINFQSDFENQAIRFTSALVSDLKSLNLVDQIHQVDHACYRTGDMASYEQAKQKMALMGTLLTESIVNGRPIASYRLQKPIPILAGFAIDVIEVPAPRADAHYEEGFEHIEVVLKADLESFQEKNRELLSRLKAVPVIERREILLPLEKGLVKFHEVALADTIAKEQDVISRRSAKFVVVMDLDDTLIASREAFLRTFHRAIESLTGKAFDLDEVRAKAKPTFPEFLQELGFADKNCLPQFLPLFQQHWFSFSTDCSVPVGVSTLLSCLYHAGIEVHVWTARDSLTANSMLKDANLLHFIKAIYAFDGIGKPRPPKQLEEVRRNSRAVLLGDSDSDKTGAFNLDVPFVQATWVNRNDLGSELPNVESPIDALFTLLKFFET